LAQAPDSTLAEIQAALAESGHWFNLSTIQGSLSAFANRESD
jgi:hypothetical protein